MRAIRVNHVSLHANSLEESVHFYTTLFGMETVPSPTFKVPVQWLRLGDQQLHLFVRDAATPPAFHHIGLDVDDFEAVYIKAKALGICDHEAFFSNIYELPDGSVQLYIRDPAGNLVEIDWPDVRKLDKPVFGDIPKLADAVAQSPEGLRSRLYLPAEDGSLPLLS